MRQVVPAAPAPASAAPTAAPMSPEQWAASQPKMGFLESIAESVTGRARTTPETQALPEWTTMPELNQMSLASFKSALGSLVSNPKETVQILQSNFPQLGVRQDEKGNFILRSSVDQKEYAIPPGFTVGDIPRAVGGLLAFTPAGRATSILGAVGKSALTQTAIEGTQAATGGQFDKGEVAVAGATGPVGQILQKVAPPVVQAVKKGVQRVTGKAPAPTGVAGAPMGTAITPEAPPAAAVMPEIAPITPEITVLPAAPVAPAAPARSQPPAAARTDPARSSATPHPPHAPPSPSPHHHPRNASPSLDKPGDHHRTSPPLPPARNPSCKPSATPATDCSPLAPSAASP